MNRLSSRIALSLGVMSLVLVLCGCPNPAKQAGTPGTPQYTEAVATFYTGTIGLQTGDTGGVAKANLEKMTQIAPQEPAGWANLALQQIRLGELQRAADSIQKAVDRDPKKDKIGTARILAIEGLLAVQQGNFDEAVAKLKEAASLDTTNLKMAYKVIEVLNQQSPADLDTQTLVLLKQLQKVEPRNLEVLLSLARVQAKTGDAAAFKATIQALVPLSKDWDARSKEVFAEMLVISATPNVRPAAAKVAALKNLLSQFPEYRVDRDRLVEPTTQTGTPLQNPLVLPAAPPTPAPSDTALKYTLSPVGGARAAKVWAFALDEAGKPAVFATDGQSVRRVDIPNAPALPFPGKPGAPIGNHAVAAVDIDNDIRADLVFAGALGVRLFRQTEKGDFVDALPQAKLPPAITKAAYTGAWALDVEADGDLDILLATPNGAPIVLRNNGDNSFVVVRPFAGVKGVRAFAWGDFGGGGLPDAAFVDGAGKLVTFTNERGGAFRLHPTPPAPDKIADAVVMDVDGSGSVDLLTLAVNGAVSTYSYDANNKWVMSKPLFQSDVTGADVRLLVGELDNNGALDMLVSGGEKSDIRLLDAPGKLANGKITISVSAAALVDTNGDGLLDIVGLANGAPTQVVSASTKKYNYQNITLIPNQRRIAEDPEKRINSFAIGGEIDMRAGLLYAKQPITAPQMHFGLGENKSVNITRITWPNGNPQSEFNLKINATIAPEQRLGGSCPFLFAWDGTQFRFVTDCIWRSPLGLKINAQTTVDTMQTLDWVKIPGAQLKARNGFYDLVITAELRETHFFDHLSLKTVDHPEGTEIWVDERLAFPQPPLRVYATTPTRPFAQVHDDQKADVSRIVAARDKNYLDTFGRGAYQGVTRDHYVEFELPDDAPTGKPIYLVAFGWVHPTDTSINVGMGQNPSVPKPTGLSLETPDARGNWTTAKKDLGFPEGKVKTIVIRIDDAAKQGAKRIFRLRTNLEIFWDELQWAEALPDMPLRVKNISLNAANLRYRGFSVVKAKNASSPELPQDYNQLSGTVEQWRNLEGFHTRFGDIKPLLTAIDDRYLIMNAGDAMDLRFPAQSPPPPGWVRDYVLVGDGWVKDGNLNTTFGKTVLPLPTHTNPKYNVPPTTLEADPVYKRHASDWANYHTRYISNERFARSLRPE